jgi:type I restriction enzyme S subunit
VSAEHIIPLTGELVGVKSAAEDGMESGKYLFDAGDVLYSKLRPYLRKAALPTFAGLCSADIYPIKTDQSRLVPQFLRLLLVSDEFNDHAGDASARSRMPKLNREQIFSYEFTLPSLDGQTRIVDAVAGQLAKTETARKAAETQREDVDALLAAIYREAFVQVVPVAVPSSLCGPPHGWQWRKLTEVARLESGHTPSRSRPDWWGGDVSWISLTEIRALDGQWVDSTQLRTNAAGIANSAARILPRGTVCYSRTASVGFVAIMAMPMATSQDFANWVCGDALDPEFLMHALIRGRKELRALATGATHKTIYMPTLQSFHVCAPELARQRQIVLALKQRLTEVTALRVALDAQQRELAKLPQRLLAQALEN